MGAQRLSIRLSSHVRQQHTFQVLHGVALGVEVLADAAVLAAQLHGRPVAAHAEADGDEEAGHPAMFGTMSDADSSLGLQSSWTGHTLGRAAPSCSAARPETCSTA